MSKFKVGDQVRCVDNEDWKDTLTLGRDYSVTVAHKDGFVDICAEAGRNVRPGGWREDRFALAAPSVPAPKFKVGDQVRLCSVSPGGQTYTVTRVGFEEVWVSLNGFPSFPESNWATDQLEFAENPRVPAPKPRYRSRSITEISVDGGKTWIEAEPEYQALSLSGIAYSGGFTLTGGPRSGTDIIGPGRFP